MDFSTSKGVRKQKTSKSVNAGTGHRLQFYVIPPRETVTLQEFEEYAVERLKGKSILESIHHVAYCRA